MAVGSSLHRHRQKNKKHRKTTTFKMYVLASTDGKRTYVGVTKDLHHRLRQHNGEIAGGAKATRGRTWRVAVCVDGFASDGAALSVEKSMHNKGRWLFKKRLGSGGAKKTVLERRIECLFETLRDADPKKFDKKPKVSLSP